MDNYLKVLKYYNIRPNFWCSDEYFQKAGWKSEEKGEIIYVLDSDGVVVLPVIEFSTGKILEEIPCWAGFKGMKPGRLLDLEFIYEAANFDNLKGKSWQAFRKNARKFERRAGEETLFFAAEPQHEKGIWDLVVEWLDKQTLIHDSSVMLEYMAAGRNRDVLVGIKSGKVYGINVWDENHCFINYRYCICLPEPELFLSEYMRLIFYKRHPGRLINDGGVLDDPRLEAFKRKLNPIEVNPIFTYLKEE